MLYTDRIYQQLLKSVLGSGSVVSTRNHEVSSSIDLPNTTFIKTPLVTLRTTAWRKAIREMEWFMSGNEMCPDELLDWWKGQLDKDGILNYGYPKQFRNYTTEDYEGFDQVKFMLDSLNSNPHSRRLILSIWHPGEMANITSHNNNPNTPTCYHSIVVQFFVRDNRLWIKTYQRSADMLLGVPHNWIQSWAMLLYFAYYSGLGVGGMIWVWGDAHIYTEPSHILAAIEIVKTKFDETNVSQPTLVYLPKQVTYDYNRVPVFKASDFHMEGVIPRPITNVRPKLL